MASMGTLSPVFLVRALKMVRAEECALLQTKFFTDAKREFCPFNKQKKNILSFCQSTSNFVYKGNSSFVGSLAFRSLSTLNSSDFS